ncbi:GGDEF domain-containing protein [Shewanella cyperi]|uniref:diguanylate cyclase n=1 Tax=Shewanella cyperi TaxID=2814292 RepID=A0A974XJ39_9GAMM|nr:diguanylate cyclase [Shewanella cyperi]QSX29345.1 GGDEF domain-containing protein [Shewanella cyperi]
MWPLCALANRAPDSQVAPTKYLDINNPQAIMAEHLWLLREEQQRLTPEQVLAYYRSGLMQTVGKGVPAFGIGSSPVWLLLPLINPGTGDSTRVLQLGVPWTDEIRLWQLGPDQDQEFVFGDNFSGTPYRERLPTLTLTLAPGETLLMLRAESKDPLVLPLTLQPPEAQRQSNSFYQYSYGFFYGAICILMGYNLMLYVGMRSRSYLLYSLFLLSFLFTNLSYTGHGMLWLWPSGPHWQQWLNPLLMTLFCTMGLLFALRFLQIGKLRPQLRLIVLGLLGVIWLMQLLALAFDSRSLSLILAFDLVLFFSFLMPLLGAISLASGNYTARLFLLASLSSMVGCAITGLAVRGIIPFNQFTFRIAEIGVLIDMILLALALAEKFRIAERQRLAAEQQARIDPLTGLINRRAFDEQIRPWVAQGHKCHLGPALLMLDIDRFKTINDTLGHALGDKVLTDIATCIKQSLRSQDICGRWGGEEFVILLPETGLHAAETIAERIRTNIAALNIGGESADLSVSASVGLCVDTGCRTPVESLIRHADQLMYLAKQDGGNRVYCDHKDMAVTA